MKNETLYIQFLETRIATVEAENMDLKQQINKLRASAKKTATRGVKKELPASEPAALTQ